MRSRRSFLAEAGVVLTGLLLPGAAHAWRWRGRRIICPPCPCPCPCPPLPHAPVPEELKYGCLLCLAPQGCYGQSDGTFFYDCCYCDGCTNYDDSYSDRDLPVPADCTNDCSGFATCRDTACICTSMARWPSYWPRTQPRECVPNARYVLKQPVASNVKPTTKKEKWGKRIKNVVPQPKGLMVYVDPITLTKPIIAVLANFHITYNDNSERDLNVGLECKPPIMEAPVLGRPDQQHPGLKGHHRVWSSNDNRLYHVLTVQ